MRPLSLHEIVDRERYEALRPAYRDAVIAHKRDRRVALGDRVSLVFEDRETLRFQVQEMAWVERIDDADRIQHELDVYNELMPAERQFSATLFVEIVDLAEIRPELERLIGIDEHVAMLLGDDETPIPARFDPKQMEAERLSAVQYIKFTLDADQARRFADTSIVARIRVDHPNYPCNTELPAPVRQSLAADLSREPTPLLEAPGKPPAPQGPPGDEVVFESPQVRVLRPARPRTPGHLVVESTGPMASILEVAPEQAQELLLAVQRAAREVTGAYGACRIQTDVSPAEARLRVHILPARSDR